MHSNRISLLIVLLTALVSVQAQTPATSTPVNAATVPVIATASVTGQIKIGETPARSVSVALVAMGAGNRQLNTDATTRVTTDADGRYKFTNLVAGNYRVTVLAPGYVVFGTSDLVRNGQQVTLKEAEAVERIDFTLTRGGVITGKVVNSNNRPVINEAVNISTVDDTGQQTPFNPPSGAGGIRTDDRGVYRAYGLPPGKYLVSAGQGDGRGGGPGFVAATRAYIRTYHPETTDVSQATLITVEAGKEVAEVDIRMAALETYAAAGSVIDAESGKPVMGALIGHSSVRGGGGGRGQQIPQGPGSTDGMTGNEGEFRIEGLARGNYTVSVTQDPQNPVTTEYYSQPVTFEIASSDVTGLEIKLQRGASVTGTVVLDGSTDLSILANVMVNASVRGSGVGRTSSTANVAPSGLFRVSGLAPGRVSLNVSDATNPGPFSGLQILRMEKDGADMQSGLEVAQGEQVAGVRVYIAYGTSIVRGVIQPTGGTLTPDIRLMAMARRTDGGNTVGGGGFGGGGTMPAQVDANGRFQISNLVPGTYTISIQSMGGFGGGGFGGGGFGGGQGQGRPQGQGAGQGQPAQGQPQFQGQQRQAAASQTVVVGNGTTQDVVIPLDLTTLPTLSIQNGQPGNQNRNPNNSNTNSNNSGRRRP